MKSSVYESIIEPYSQTLLNIGTQHMRAMQQIPDEHKLRIGTSDMHLETALATTVAQVVKLTYRTSVDVLPTVGAMGEDVLDVLEVDDPDMARRLTGAVALIDDLDPQGSNLLDAAIQSGWTIRQDAQKGSPTATLAQYGLDASVLRKALQTHQAGGLDISRLLAGTVASCDNAAFAMIAQLDAPTVEKVLDATEPIPGQPGSNLKRASALLEQLREEGIVQTPGLLLAAGTVIDRAVLGEATGCFNQRDPDTAELLANNFASSEFVSRAIMNHLRSPGSIPFSVDSTSYSPN